MQLQHKQLAAEYHYSTAGKLSEASSTDCVLESEPSLGFQEDHRNCQYQHTDQPQTTNVHKITHVTSAQKTYTK